MEGSRPLAQADPLELEVLRREAEERLAAARARGLDLDMTRGKPSPEQLDLASPLLACVGADDFRAADGTDCRNYGGLEGLPEARRLFADYLEVRPEQILIGGNASLELMHDLLALALLRAVPGGGRPWVPGAVKFLCPCPGYDRHFSICEHFGVEMIPVGIGTDGPDVEAIARLARDDEAVRGMFCVPKYSNPTAVTYSTEVIRSLATMQTRAEDFRIFCDNAYARHHLAEPPDQLPPILDAFEAAGQPDRVFLFGSTSKVSLAGAGLALVAASERNLAYVRKNRSIQTIGPDKLNQLRHVRFFGDVAGIEAHMRRHAEILRPKFEAVQEILERRLGGLEVAQWSRPRGGYFISLDTLPGSAKRVVAMAAELGVKLTPAGATFPYGRDPEDRNIRIAPSMPAVEDLRAATEVLAACLLLVAVEQRLGRSSRIAT